MINVRSFIFLLFALAVTLADQLSKWAVLEFMIRPQLGATERLGFITWISQDFGRLPFVEIPIWPFFNIVMVWNKGISFGMFNTPGEYGPLILIVLSGIIALGFTIWLFRSRNCWQSLGLALVIGGAIGNIIDRARLGAVIDFLDVHAYGYHWPAFNIADSAVVVGVIILIIHGLFFEKSLPERP